MKLEEKKSARVFQNQPKSKQNKKSLIIHASAFAQDLTDLCPLSKLNGINSSKATEKILPNLSQLSKDDVDRLQYASDALLYPANELMACDSWRRSGLRIYAITHMIRRLHQLDSSNMAIHILNSLKIHAEALELKDCSDKFHSRIIDFMQDIYSNNAQGNIELYMIYEKDIFDTNAEFA